MLDLKDEPNLLNGPTNGTANNSHLKQRSLQFSCVYNIEI